MTSVHILFDQAKYCILDTGVLILFCIGIARVVWYEAGRLRDPKRHALGRTAAARTIIATAQPRAGRTRKPRR